MSGLDRVPFDGYKAVVHEGEMIPTPGISAELRAMGVTATSIPDSLREQTVPRPNVSVAPVVRGRDQGDRQILVEMQKMNARAERAERRAEASEREANALRQAIARGTERTAAEVEAARDDAHRDARKLAAAVTA